MRLRSLAWAMHGWACGVRGRAGPPRGFIRAFDSLYCWYHNLRASEADIAPALLVEIRRARKTRMLGDGTTIRPGCRIGVLHLNNDRVALLHRQDGGPLAVGLAFKHRLVQSLERLADLARPDGRLADVDAYSAITIFHHGLPRLGFERDPHRLLLGRMIAAYQRALLASLHPAGIGRAGLARGTAERVWLSRARLLARYGRTARAG